MEQNRYWFSDPEAAEQVKQLYIGAAAIEFAKTHRSAVVDEVVSALQPDESGEYPTAEAALDILFPANVNNIYGISKVAVRASELQKETEERLYRSTSRREILRSYGRTVVSGCVNFRRAIMPWSRFS
jgi:hypothetical protein